MQIEPGMMRLHAKTVSIITATRSSLASPEAARRPDSFAFAFALVLVLVLVLNLSAGSSSRPKCPAIDYGNRCVERRAGVVWGRVNRQRDVRAQR